jgi:hypothetical protein
MRIGIMMPFKFYSFAIISVLILSSSVFSEDITFELEWAPADSIEQFPILDLKTLEGKKVIIENVIDERDNKNEIGQNIERKRPRNYKTNTDLSKWSTKVIKYLLLTFRVKVVKKDPDFIISPTLLKFYVTEKETYKGAVALKIVVKTLQNDQIWQGVTNGSSNRWGMSFSPDNFLETICNSFADAIYNLLKDQSFTNTFSKRVSGGF